MWWFCVQYNLMARPFEDFTVMHGPLSIFIGTVRFMILHFRPWLCRVHKRRRRSGQKIHKTLLWLPTKAEWFTKSAVAAISIWINVVNSKRQGNCCQTRNLINDGRLAKRYNLSDSYIFINSWAHWKMMHSKLNLLPANGVHFRPHCQWVQGSTKWSVHY